MEEVKSLGSVLAIKLKDLLSWHFEQPRSVTSNCAEELLLPISGYYQLESINYANIVPSREYDPAPPSDTTSHSATLRSV